MQTRIPYVHKVKTTRRKAELRAKRGIFVGYPESRKGWIVLDPETGAEIVSRDVEFHEDQPSGSLWHRRSEWTEIPSADLDSDDSDDDEQEVPAQPELTKRLQTVTVKRTVANGQDATLDHLPSCMTPMLFLMQGEVEDCD